MSWNDLVYGLGDVIEATFVIATSLGNIPNILFTLVIIAGLAYWVMQLDKYKKRAEETGEIE